MNIEAKNTLKPTFFIVESLCDCEGCIMFFYLCVSASPCRGESKACPLLHPFCEKVPDPRNSHIFGPMKHQVRLTEMTGLLCLL